MTASLFCGLNHLLMSGVWTAKFNVVFNRICKKIHALEHHRNIFHQAVQFEIPYVRTAYGNLPSVHIPKPGNQIAHCGLTCTGRANNGSCGLFRNSKTDLIQYLTVCVGKIHLIKHNLAGLWRNVAAFLVHYRSIINGVCRVHRGRQHLQQRSHVPGIFQIVEHHERSDY